MTNYNGQYHQVTQHVVYIWGFDLGMVMPNDKRLLRKHASLFKISMAVKIFITPLGWMNGLLRCLSAIQQCAIVIFGGWDIHLE